MDKQIGILRQYALKASLKRHEDFQEFLGVTHVDVLNFREFKKEGGPLLSLEEFSRSEKSFVEAEGVEPCVTSDYFGYLVRR